MRPSSRGKGYGKEMLRLGLEEARKMGIQKVMLSCNEDNLASIGVIEANGGRDFRPSISPFDGKPIRIYWIDLSPC